MTVAASIFVLVLGIVFFVADRELGDVSLRTPGLILIVLGAAGVCLGLIQHAYLARRGRRQAAAAKAAPRD